mmetsp:Transcript_11266/g.32487  ORF Transcript_11266/g.32487 Transcript_11266/m.32487 type:complete len:80 (+) Transcript_11266:582-821(+)
MAPKMGLPPSFFSAKSCIPVRDDLGVDVGVNPSDTSSTAARTKRVDTDLTENIIMAVFSFYYELAAVREEIRSVGMASA